MRADIFIHQASKYRRHRLPFIRLTDFWSSRRFPFNELPEIVKIRDFQIIEKGGWHFNNLIQESEIIQKIESSCHVEWNTEEIRINAIRNYRIASDIYTGQKHTIVSIDEGFPEVITSNISRWSPFIFK
jgi:hypothetical protein